MPTAARPRRRRTADADEGGVVRIIAERLSKGDTTKPIGLEQDPEERSLLPSSLGSVFCPRAFRKGRLAEGYARFQAFDTLQALCSYLRGVLCTQAILKGLGVGSSEASAAAAALTFITRDGMGMLGGLGLAWTCSDSFGHRIKAWRLFADIANDVALTLDLYAPTFAPSNTFVILVCISSVLKAWCGVAAGATRAVITSHFALHAEDLADIAVKEGSQETAVTLTGMILGYLFLKYEGDPSDARQTYLIWTLFWFLTAVHVWANYEAVRSLHFRTLDWTRLDIVLKHKMRTFKDVSALEPVIPRRPSVAFPTFGLDGLSLKERQRFVTCPHCPNVAVYGSRIVVGESAGPKEVLCAAISLRWIQLNGGGDLGLEDDVATMTVKIMPSYMEIIELLEEHGWDLENSRSLLGDVLETRARLLSA